MGKKSNKLFAILVIPVSVNRDKKLSEIMEVETSIEYVKKKYICGGNSFFGQTSPIYFSSDFSKIKTWKTYKGCESFMSKLASDKEIISGLLYEESLNDQGDWNNPSYEIVSIEKEWNQHIDNQIDTYNKRHQELIKNLKKTKVCI